MTRGLARLALLCASLSACGGDAPPPLPSPPPLLSVEPGVLRLAGTGAAMPLARALGSAFHETAAGHALRVVVEESIGSGGGVQATFDGAADVGMISRRLSEREAALGLVQARIATDAVLVAAQSDVPIDDLSADDLVAIYAGTLRQFPDGSPVTLILRDRGESANGALDAAVPGLAAARERGYRMGFRVLYHDDSMAAALALTPGAVGVYSLGLLTSTRIPLKVLSVGGRKPSLETLANGTWPISRPIAFVARPDRLGHVRAFLDFARGDAGRRITRERGYLPVSVDAGEVGPR